MKTAIMLIVILNPTGAATVERIDGYASMEACISAAADSQFARGTDKLTPPGVAMYCIPAPEGTKI